jgi:hypothetical protein
MLGRLIDNLENPDVMLGLVAVLDAPDLLKRIGRAAEADGRSPSDYLAISVRAFVDQASDDVWLQLVGIMNRAEDPSLAALRAILDAILPSDRPAVVPVQPSDT